MKTTEKKRRRRREDRERERERERERAGAVSRENKLEASKMQQSPSNESLRSALREVRASAFSVFSFSIPQDKKTQREREREEKREESYENPFDI